MLHLHNLGGVFALPFHALILLSGLLIQFPLYLSAAIDALYPGQTGQFEVQANADYSGAATGTAGPLASPDGMLAQAHQHGAVVSLRSSGSGTLATPMLTSKSAAAWPTARAWTARPCTSTPLAGGGCMSRGCRPQPRAELCRPGCTWRPYISLACTACTFRGPEWLHMLASGRRTDWPSAT
ncbi:PepSY-associated TM helix domain-containing protein [Pseudomonas sp. WHRI 8519]|uniref:PepSY-associated TM helix domain-containing protein n=1 Tax=Pseudomonas sp. WHRI 8519 TaxID=3162567 RepID=UPI0032ED9CE9